MKCLVDFTSPIKGRNRLYQGLLPALEEVSVAEGVELDYLISHSMDRLPARGRFHVTPNVKDLYISEVYIPRLAGKYDSLFTFRDNIRLPRNRRWPVVLQLHEHPRLRPHRWTSIKNALWSTIHSARTARALSNADVILFSSDWTRREFLRLEGRLPDQHEVVWLAGWPDASLNGPAPAQQDSYILMMASRDVRDDLSWGRRVCSFLPGRIDYVTVVGEVSHLEGALRSERQVGRVSDPELRALFAGASAYLHIGRFEGFGLSVVEALQVGTPVVARRGSATDELLSAGGGLLVGEDPQEAADALCELIRDPSIRAVSFKAGERFRWSSTAARVASSLQHAASRTTT